MTRWSSSVPKDAVTQVSEQLLYVDVESFSTSEGTLLKQRMTTIKDSRTVVPASENLPECPSRVRRASTCPANANVLIPGRRGCTRLWDSVTLALEINPLPHSDFTFPKQDNAVLRSWSEYVDSSIYIFVNKPRNQWCGLYLLWVRLVFWSHQMRQGEWVLWGTVPRTRCWIKKESAILYYGLNCTNYLMVLFFSDGERCR